MIARFARRRVALIVLSVLAVACDGDSASSSGGSPTGVTRWVKTDLRAAKLGDVLRR